VRTKYKHILTLLLLIVAFSALEAQEGLLKESPLQIGVGTGAFNFKGEINNSGVSSPLTGQVGVSFDASRKLYSFLDVGFTFLNGTMTANEQGGKHLNFQTSINAISVYGFYNWEHLFHNSVMRPYTSIGIETCEFNSKSDMVASNGSPYYYWNDGSIKNLPQGDANATALSRDYVYETDLRKANLDGLGEYSQVSFAIPIGMGLLFDISDRFHLRMGTTLHYTFTDLVDNISVAGTGARAGNAASDYYFFNSVSLHYDWLGSMPAAIKKFQFVDYFALNTTDADHDGVFDWYDHCLYTPKGAEVDSNGCPIDTDLDGIADYKDKQVSADSALVNNDGVEMTDADYMNWYRRFIDSVDVSVDVRRRIAAENVGKGATYRVFVGEFDKIPDTMVERFLAQPDIISALTKDNHTMYLVGKLNNLDSAKALQQKLLGAMFPIAKIVIQRGTDFVALEDFDNVLDKEGKDRENEKLKNVEGQYALQLGNTAADANLEQKAKFYEGKEEVKTLKAEKNSTDYLVGSFNDLTAANLKLKELDKTLFPNSKVVKVKDSKIVNENDSAFFEKPKPLTIDPLAALEGKYVVKAGKIDVTSTTAEKKKLEEIPNAIVLTNADGSKDVLVAQSDDVAAGKKSLIDVKAKGLAKAELLKVEQGKLTKLAPELKEGEYAVKVGNISAATSAEEKKKLESIPNAMQLERGDGSKDIVVGTYKQMEAASKTLTDFKKKGYVAPELLKVENGKLKSASSSSEPVAQTLVDSTENKSDLKGKFAVKVGEFEKDVPSKEVDKLLSIPDVQGTTTLDPSKTIYTAGQYKDEADAKKRATQLNEQGFNTELVKHDGKKFQDVPNTKAKATQTEVSTNAVVYRVQLGAFKNKVSTAAFKGINVVSFEGKDLLVRYATGSFDAYTKAQEHKLKMRGNGFADAFVAAYKDGDRISITDLVKANEYVAGSEVKTEKVAPKSEIEKEIIAKKVEEKVVVADPVKVVYKVQLAAASVTAEQSEETKQIPQLEIEVANNYRRYLSGSFDNFADAVKRKEEMAKKGFPNAYVVSYQNGKRISIAPAVDENTIRPSEVQGGSDTAKFDISSLKIQVQVGLFSLEVPADIKVIFDGIADLKMEITPQGLKRYVSGDYKNPGEAVAYKESLKAKGLKDAFLIAHFKGEKITLANAIHYYENKK